MKAKISFECLHCPFCRNQLIKLWFLSLNDLTPEFGITCYLCMSTYFRRSPIVSWNFIFSMYVWLPVSDFTRSVVMFLGVIGLTSLLSSSLKIHVKDLEFIGSWATWLTLAIILNSKTHLASGRIKFNSNCHHLIKLFDHYLSVLNMVF